MTEKLYGQEAIDYANENGLNVHTEDERGITTMEADRLLKLGETIWVEVYDPNDAASHETHFPA